METRNGLVGWVKEATATECDVGLGLRMQPAQSFPQKMMMVMPHHDHPSHEALPSNGGFGWETGGGRHMFCNTSNQVAPMRDIYDLVVGADAGSGARAAVVPKPLNPSNTDIFTFNSSGGMAASENVRDPFTAAQWQELERQAMAYKYMMASVPVPPQILVPFTKSPSNVAHSHSNYGNGGSWELGFSNNSDPEPWRCRRTDGKKWRCSRDATLDQKYCERHSHKSRPRSRKPVESEAQFINNNEINNNATTKPYQKPHFFNRTCHNHPCPTTMVSVSATSCEPSRCLEWFTKGESFPVAGATQESWQQMMQFNVELNNCVTHVGDGQGLQTLEGALNLNHTQQKRHFLDAWSTAEGDNNNIGEINNNCSKLPLSDLAPSMCVGNEINEESKNDQMGAGTSGSERENGGDMKSPWMNSLSWMSSPPGGPLAEALYLGNIDGSAKAGSPFGCSNGATSSRSPCREGGK
ncbi:growth-regulating factor 8-like [Corylus avellana]|uniref:growth-regulating factor 8-like n=1 Tax=Corylus avellana TaxID=13451 RepID=UPI001E20EB38|nr:growth-regulating factor 8-like [Corylus avellana]